MILVLKVRAMLHYPGERVPIDVHDAWSPGAEDDPAVDLSDVGPATYTGSPCSGPDLELTEYECIGLIDKNGMLEKP